MSAQVTFASIMQNTQIAPDIYLMEIQSAETAEAARPGQFLHIRCTDSLSPLLRRPISIADADKKTGNIKIIYRVVGQGTQLLCRKRPGDSLDIIGPLGQGFPMPDEGQTPVIVGGGIGVAPLLFLAKSVVKETFCPMPKVFLGFETKQEAFGIEFFESLGIELEICTDDGSLGNKCFPTALLKEYLEQCQDKSKLVIYACGPRPMLAGLKDIASAEDITAYFSMEERMACGVGACLGCSVKSSQGAYKKVCKDGPVFEAGEIELT
ncbi:MAG: dihydroorotate dehydrogenase electron transfer subunit [Tepidanaerobacteraceae bacterium]|nr:dihydroorotate dehydrogenase electron transfer subunit [Tepidanaerobacteraceae bacterium]